MPGLFEGDEFTTLMTQCKEGSQRDGLMLDSSEELYKWFTRKVGRVLHLNSTGDIFRSKSQMIKNLHFMSGCE